MKATYEKKHNRFFLVMLAVAAVCSFSAFRAEKNGVSGLLANALGTVVTPVQSALSGLHGAVEDKFIYFREMDALLEENEKLKNEVVTLQRKVSALEPTEKENAMLYKFLDLKRDDPEMTFVKADVISRSTSNYTSDFTIDKGSLHGLAKDMAVISEDGSLLGILVEVGATFARGKTLTSYDLSVGVKNERTGDAALLSGDIRYALEGYAVLKDVPDTTDILSGDILRTSGLGGIYPQGLYVGTVTEIVPDMLDYTLDAVIKPSQSVFDTDMVMIVTEFR